MEKLATALAVRISTCNTMEELELVRKDVQAFFIENPKLKDGWGEWLRDCRDSKIFQLKEPHDLGEHLTKEGKKWLNS